MASILLAGCEVAEVVVDRYRSLTPHEAYEASLVEAGLSGTALGRDWTRAARRATEEPHVVELPYREEGFIAEEEPDAVGYRFSIQRGQVLTLHAEVDSEEATRVFVDLFRVPEDEGGALRPLLLTDTTANGLVYEPPRSGDFILRLQPELLRGGRFRVTLTLDAALSFPVEGVGIGAVQSFFGAERDAGRRSHHGVDIFARRGTPALAASDGTVSRVQVTRLGGKVVWIRDTRRGANLYYAHLDSQVVRPGQRVLPGDTVGFVGNTGNARTTPPHLHFGIYSRGPTDPLPFIRTPPGRLADMTVDLTALGGWGRVEEEGIRLRSAPSQRGDVLRELDRFTAFRVLGGAGDWYRIRLPDGRTGYLAGRLTDGVDAPLRFAVVAGPDPIRARPWHTSPAVVPVEAGTALPVLGAYGGYLLVEAPDGHRGWIVGDR
jgi:murein DD-endopeptidase MepM/ murein hydrolase activator NlpD